MAEYYEKRRMKLLFRAIRYRAKKRGVPFDLRIEDVEVPEFCPVLSIKLDYSTKETRPEIDRIVPSLGYVKGNIRVISGRANRIKSDATVEELRALFLYALGNISL